MADLFGWLAVAAAVAVFFVLAIGPHLFGYRTMVMLTGSMRPHLPPGAVLLDTSKPTSQLRPGDVLTYHIPIDDHRVVSHRVLSVKPVPNSTTGAVQVQTKGDANNGPDPWVAIIKTDKVWVVRGAVPHLGDAIIWLRCPAVQLASRWLVPAVLLAWLLCGIWFERDPEEGDADEHDPDQPAAPTATGPTNVAVTR